MAGAKCGLYIHTLKVTAETPAKAALESNNAAKKRKRSPSVKPIVLDIMRAAEYEGATSA